MDISEATICHMLIDLEFPTPRMATEFDQRLGQTQDKALMRDQALRASLMRWVADHIMEQGEDPKWISTQAEPIVKTFLIFTGKFW